MKDAQLEEDLQALAKAFLLLKTEEECTAFLKDVCTYQELRALSQRLHVARLLRKQYVFHEIVQETGASTATISRVNRTLRDSTGGYQAVLEQNLQENGSLLTWKRTVFVFIRHSQRLTNRKVGRVRKFDFDSANLSAECRRYFGRLWRSAGGWHIQPHC